MSKSITGLLKKPTRKTIMNRKPQKYNSGFVMAALHEMLTKDSTEDYNQNTETYQYFIQDIRKVLLSVEGEKLFDKHSDFSIKGLIDILRDIETFFYNLQDEKAIAEIKCFDGRPKKPLES